MPNIIDLAGERFGKLVALQFLGRVNKHSIFLCICDCGKETTATSNNLRRNHTTSCGCESSKNTIGVRLATHGKSKHPLFISWVGMRNRCYTPTHNRFEHYGGKGIAVCDEWVDDFQAFYNWAILNGWKKGLTLDRKENDRDYCPDNCKFSTVAQQNRNRTSNIKLTINGITKILIEWSEEVNVPYETIRQRLKNGWIPEEAIYGRKNHT